MRAIDRNRAKRRTNLEQRRALRRQRRLRRETPRAQQARELAQVELVEKGSAKVTQMMEGLLPVMARGSHEPRRMPVECTCVRPDGTRPNHGPHWIASKSTQEKQEDREAA